MHEVKVDGDPFIVRANRSAFAARADDGHYYWITLPSKDRTAAYKAYGTLIADACGLSCARPAKVTISSALLKELLRRGCRSDEVFTEHAGFHLGSRYPADPTANPHYDLLPTGFANRIRNPWVFSFATGIGLWIGNPEPQHAVYVRQPERDFAATIIGFGGSFTFGTPSRRMFEIERELRNSSNAFEHVNEAFESISQLTENDLRRLARMVPTPWWSAADRSIDEIVAQLCHRRAVLPVILSEFDSDFSGASSGKGVPIAYISRRQPEKIRRDSVKWRSLG